MNDPDRRLSIEFLKARQEESDRLSFSREDPIHPDHHRTSLGTVQSFFGIADLNLGLTSQQVLQQQALFGPNKIIPKGRNWILTLLNYFFGGFNGFLWFASILSWIAWRLTALGGASPDPGDLSLACALIIVAIINVAITFYQEYTSSAVMESINSMVAQTALVLRNGERKRVNSSELVPGDVIDLAIGDRVPADMRIVSVSGLKVDQSMLTGENEPVALRAKCTSENYLESKNMTFCGANVVEGSGAGIVVAIGNSTVMGLLAKKCVLPNVSGAKKKPTYLSLEIRRAIIIIISLCVITCFISVGRSHRKFFGFASRISAVACFFAFVFWLRVKYPTFMNWAGIVATICGLMVAYAPAGLPLCVVLALLFIAKRMARNHVLVKDLTIVETLGSINAIASDKTGTLTQNKMLVAEVCYGDKSILVGSKGFLAAFQSQNKLFSILVQSVALCNGSNIDATTEEPLGGGATDEGILRFAMKFLDVDKARSDHKKIVEMPFNSKIKCMLSIHEMAPRKYELLMKGAAEKMLEKSQFYMDQEGNVQNLTVKRKSQLQAIQQEMCKKGQRVLGIVKKEIKYSVEHPFLDQEFNLDDYPLPIEDGFIFVGFVSLRDPPREEVAEVIEKCHQAGIKVIMVTGDHQDTAVAIGKMIGLVASDNVHTIEDYVKGEKYDGFVYHEESFEEEKDDQIQGKTDDEEANIGTTKKQQAIVVVGSQLVEFDDSMWDFALSHRDIVFARTSPDNKLEIVKQMQKRKLSVAVTGDGVNDSPALKQADVGVAMGGGAEVAREAASVILTDNNFKSLLVGVENGRLIFDNLKKVFRYLLPAGTFSEAVPVILNVFFGLPAPLSAFLMIYICVITDVAPCLSLVFERSEEDVMNRKPRRRHAHILDGWVYLLAYGLSGVVESLTALVLFFYYMQSYGGIDWKKLWFAFDKFPTSGSDIDTNWPKPTGGYYTGDELGDLVKYGQTVFFVTLVVVQFGNLLASKQHKSSFFHSNPFFGPNRNRFAFLSIPVSLVLALIIVYIPGLNNIFNTRPIPWLFWFLPLYASLGLFTLLELRKLIWRKLFPIRDLPCFSGSSKRR